MTNILSTRVSRLREQFRQQSTATFFFFFFFFFLPRTRARTGAKKINDSHKKQFSIKVLLWLDVWVGYFFLLIECSLFSGSCVDKGP
ncbi:hypothetical protein BCR41DRAFT_20671 [Lobosporangium transversale]|uniref:Uncharacterized protein n=1 Tax=Lobosporangium transversale TaxID=64571 RepID=A0A1Y2GWQ2_9FUNG|nr:hypothetical protein BCR41DRAFT_20671 [Lobosporangium transversale]ORZ21777.1 hypothetical protein BCR41DRAFT_20671 [Lobosporangium transversale]|eukprot:XP_021883028.1 hypothetical protein BCR41DRAFT_20671 [Lobosporangium transversale]